MHPNPLHPNQHQPGLLTADSFQSLLCYDNGQDAYTQEHEKSEYERYILLGQGGPGKADDPLKWWKVSCL